MKVKIKSCFAVFVMMMGMLLSAMTASAYQSENAQGIPESLVIDEIPATDSGTDGVFTESASVTEEGANGTAVAGEAQTMGGDMAAGESADAGNESVLNGTAEGSQTVNGDANAEGSQLVGTVQGSGTGDTPFSIPGNGLLLDDKSEDGTKQFLTIRTKNGNTFFMVLDRSNNTENVYMLSMIDENDLAEFIEDAQDKPKTETPSLVIPQKEAPSTDLEPTEEKGQAEKELKKNQSSGMNTGTVFILIVILAGGIGGFYYLKVIKPNREEEDVEMEDLEFQEDESYINEDEVSDEDGGE